MMRALKFRLRRWWAYIVLGLLMLACSTAEAQTYVRPSKGTGFTAVTQTALGVNESRTTESAVYDMSSFSEISIVSTVTQVSPAAQTYTKQHAVTNFGRYIKIRARTVNSTTTNQNFSYITVFTSESPAGPFEPVYGAGGVEVLAFNISAPLSTITVAATPIPFVTTQYTRFAKGNATQVFNRTVSTTGYIASSPFLDMAAYGGLSIDVVQPAGNDDCTVKLAVSVSQGATTTQPEYSRVKSRTGYMRFGGSYAYEVPTASRWVYLTFYGITGSAGTDCSASPWTVTVTPLPYPPDVSQYPTTQAFSFDYALPAYVAPSTYTSVWVTDTDGPQNRYIIQNTGTAVARCGPNGVPQQNYRLDVGATMEVTDFIGQIFCTATTTTATTVIVTSY